MNQEKLGNIIKDIRHKNNLTQKELADMLNVTYQAVSKWENGKNMPDIAILKEISEKFNIDISLLLGTTKSKKNIFLKIIFPLIIFFIILIIIIIFAFKNKDFSFKRIGSSCTSFDITGSIAYNKDKSSIYISNIDYCGEEDNNVYSKIHCYLYEKHKDKNLLINECEEKENITLNDYLDSLSINVNDYKTTCNLYKDSDIRIDIDAYDKNGKITKFTIPLVLEDNCLE